MLWRHGSMRSPPGMKIWGILGWDHLIEAGNSLPFRKKARTVPYTTRIFIASELDSLLRLPIRSVANTGECTSPSPIVLVAKKDESLRMCVDYRHLTKSTITDADPLSRIVEILTSLNNAKLFLACDLQRWYHRIPGRRSLARKLRSSRSKAE